MLQGIRVLELGSFITAPLAAMMLADLRAEVIKVERLEGDPFRRGHGTNYGPTFLAFNRNKRSLALDITTPEGRDTILRPTVTTQLIEALRQYPRIMIAQVHGYCLGGALGLMNAHDLVIAANDAQLGMPEILRGSFGMIATSTLFHAQIPIKKAAFIQLTGRNVSGAEADRLGLVSHAVDADELESVTTEIARDIGSRHAAPLEHAKIAAQMGRDLSLSQAVQVDLLVGSRQALAIDPTNDVEAYLRSQKGGTNRRYSRPDVV